MKSTGLTRKIDELGRIVLPIELRRTLNIGDKDTLEIYVDGDSVILKKHEKSCIFCGNLSNVAEHLEKLVCPACISYLKNT